METMDLGAGMLKETEPWEVVPEIAALHWPDGRPPMDLQVLAEQRHILQISADARAKAEAASITAAAHAGITKATGSSEHRVEIRNKIDMIRDRMVTAVNSATVRIMRERDEKVRAVDDSIQRCLLSVRYVYGYIWQPPPHSYSDHMHIMMGILGRAGQSSYERDYAITMQGPENGPYIIARKRSASGDTYKGRNENGLIYSAQYTDKTFAVSLISLPELK